MKKYLLFITLSFIGLFSQAQSPEQIKHLDAYYEIAFKDWNIPGMAIAIVSGDEIIFSKGYGYSNLESNEKVDENTIEDLLSHRSGLKTFNGDLLCYASDISPEKIVISAQYLTPKEDTKLYFKMTRTSIFEAELIHWNLSSFTFKFDPNLTSLPEGKLWFEIDKNGNIESLMIDVPNPDFYFTEFNFIKQYEAN